ncbi:MAG: hypothetical protein JXR94_08175 [Candidatus Hydrogenedentes bacterium]|nr:hypothetical protein [Candidatus Hydrogenedentota bacterium]
MNGLATVAPLLLACFAVGLCLTAAAAPAPEAAEPPADALLFENEYVRYAIGPDGRNREFIDHASGTNYCDPAAMPAFAHIQKAGQTHPATAVARDGERLSLTFDESGVTAVLTAHVAPHYLTFEVVSVEGEADALAFGTVRTTLQGTADEPFACCALALNLKTDVSEIPGPNRQLGATCYRRFGFEGAKVALIGCPQQELRPVLKEVVAAAPDLPHSDIGGPWALDADAGRGSYLFDFGQITEETVDDWVPFVKSLGLNQIDFHTGRSLRFGDCRPHPDLFPRGRASVKAVIDKLHAGGIAAGLHTYAFFIAKDTPYVTPVPDPRLGKDASFTLAEAMTAESDVVPVVESTEAMSTTTGFFVRNSVTLQIGDELITYGDIQKEAPYAFTKCTRGACGTKVAAHAAGEKVYHLKECFGLFTPDADSTLLAEVAANTADTFNECGFDMIYLDALDGEDILGGRENSWHYGSKFVFEIANRLERPALFEMSTFHHHLWYVRARMGAWDHPSRWHKRFIDLHVAANRSREMFLPMNLGWWAVKTWSEGPQVTQIEPTYPDDIEYLMCKCLANDMGFALMGVNPGNIGDVPAYQRLAPIFQQYETLRHAGHFPESIKAKLREPGKEFTLEQGPDGDWQFRPIQYAKHKMHGVDGWSNAWTVTNPFGPQPARLRIEVLMSAAPYDSADGVAVEDFTDTEGAFTDRAAQPGVEATLAPSTDQVKAGSASGCLSALSTRDTPNGAWCRIGRVFEPPLNLAGQQALGMWVYGDGQGELLNVQLRSPEHTTSGGLGDHYVVVDFTGWRYVELIEPEGGRIAEYAWPYGGAYATYRECVDYGQIKRVNLWYNNLPKEKRVTCYLSPIRAVPLVKAKLANCRVTIDGRTLVLPGEAESGSYIEFNSMSDCKLYGPKGELIREMVPEGEQPVLEAGENAVSFDCDVPEGMSARAYVTVISQGEPLTD